GLLGLALVRLRVQQHACFTQLAKLVFDVQQNALSDVLFRCRLLLGCGLYLLNSVLLESPIEWLPLKEKSNCAGALRKNIDVLEAEIADLKTQIRDIFRTLATNIHRRDLGLESGFTQFGPLFQSLLSSSFEIPFG